ncbi:MAG: hypothetical protein EHM68_10060 [Lysobacterales bacterium]|nr:MAG: hypothetical protein EHM68_10060 [Xanthomonadales bacterium]
MAILFVSGINDHSIIGLDLDDTGQVVYLMDGNTSVHHRLPLKKGIAASLLLVGKGTRHTGRDRVSVALRDIDGVIMPRTFRFQPRSPQDVMKFARAEDIAFPYIVRVAGDHRQHEQPARHQF